jgi:hypothetical protein
MHSFRGLGLALALSLVGGVVTTLAPAPAEAATLSATLVQTRTTSTWAVPSPDPSGITWDAGRGRLIISDSEVDELPVYAGTNLFLSSLTGQQAAFPGGTTLPWSEEPTGVGYNASTRSLFVSDDDQDRIYRVEPGADDRYGTGDDTRTHFSTAGIGNGDPEDVAVDTEVTPDGHLLVIDGRDKEIYEYAPTADGSYALVASYDVYRHGARDPEGIAYHPGRGTILVMDGRTQKIYEVTRRGELLNVVHISEAKAIKAAGITVAPASNGSGALNLYIVDRGVDNADDPNENDGRFYEMSVSLPPLSDGSGGGTGGGSGSQDIAVRTGKDDAEERSAGTVMSGRLDIVLFKNEAQTVGLRFQGVSIPRGATVTRAHVQFQTDLTTTGAANLQIAGQAADNPPSFTTAIGNISSRATTTATVGWAPPAWSTVGARGVDQRTPDLAPVVQEIVSRSGWASGNALVLVIEGSGVRAADSYNTDAAGAPMLHVEWTG